jgi:hypothetical protein
VDVYQTTLPSRFAAARSTGSLCANAGPETAAIIAIAPARKTVRRFKLSAMLVIGRSLPGYASARPPKFAGRILFRPAASGRTSRNVRSFDAESSAYCRSSYIRVFTSVYFDRPRKV